MKIWFSRFIEVVKNKLNRLDSDIVDLKEENKISLSEHNEYFNYKNYFQIFIVFTIYLCIYFYLGHTHRFYSCINSLHAYGILT